MQAVLAPAGMVWNTRSSSPAYFCKTRVYLESITGYDKYPEFYEKERRFAVTNSCTTHLARPCLIRARSTTPTLSKRGVICCAQF